MHSHLFRARIPRKTLLECETILETMGLTLQDALRMMCAEVIAKKRLPWTPGAVDAVQLVVPATDPGDNTVSILVDADLVRDALNAKRRG